MNFFDDSEALKRLGDTNPPGNPPPGYYDVINPDGTFGGRFPKTWWDYRSNLERAALLGLAGAIVGTVFMTWLQS